jgi:hypothetical protein
VKDKDGKVIHIGTAAALDKGLKSGMSALSIIETFPKAFQNHLKDKTGALNQRGLWWANNIKVMQDM